MSNATLHRDRYTSVLSARRGEASEQRPSKGFCIQCRVDAPRRHAAQTGAADIERRSGKGRQSGESTAKATRRSVARLRPHAWGPVALAAAARLRPKSRGQLHNSYTQQPTVGTGIGTSVQDVVHILFGGRPGDADTWPTHSHRLSCPAQNMADPLGRSLTTSALKTMNTAPKITCGTHRFTGSSAFAPGPVSSRWAI